MSEQAPLVGEYPNMVERNLTSKPEEREFNYYQKLLEISNELKTNEYLLIEFEVGTAQEVLGNFRAVLADLVPMNDLEKSKVLFEQWFEERFKNLENQNIYSTLKNKSLELFEITFNSYQNKREEEILQKNLQNILKTNE